MPHDSATDRIPDLLPSSFLSPAPPSPAEILERQGELLESKTDSALVGHVRIRQSPYRFPWSGRLGPAAINAFEITVVATGAKHTLFHVVHERGKPYPLTITDIDVPVPETIETEGQFLDALRDIFNSAYCREVITELMAIGRSDG